MDVGIGADRKLIYRCPLQNYTDFNAVKSECETPPTVTVTLVPAAGIRRRQRCLAVNILSFRVSSLLPSHGSLLFIAYKFYRLHFKSYHFIGCAESARANCATSDRLCGHRSRRKRKKLVVCNHIINLSRSMPLFLGNKTARIQRARDEKHES